LPFPALLIWQQPPQPPGTALQNFEAGRKRIVLVAGAFEQFLQTFAFFEKLLAQLALELTANLELPGELRPHVMEHILFLYKIEAETRHGR